MSDIENQIINSFERISDMMRNLMWQASEPLGLNPTQANIINFIFQNPTKGSVSVLAQRLMVSKPTISDSVKSLAAKGFVTMAVSKEDSRVKVISLTTQGKQAAAQITNYTDRFYQSVSGVFMSQKSTLNESLEGLIKKLQSDELLSA